MLIFLYIFLALSCLKFYVAVMFIEEALLEFCNSDQFFLSVFFFYYNLLSVICAIDALEF